MGDDSGLIGTAIGLVVLGSVAKSVLGTRTRTRTVYRNRPKKRKLKRIRHYRYKRNLLGLK